jgi:DNA-binding CsgD family transcriptional regulator
MTLNARFRFGCSLTLLVLAACPIAAIPRGGNPLPFELASSPWYQLYWLIALGFGISAIARILAMAARDGDDHVWSMMYFYIIFVVTNLCIFLGELNYRNPLYDDVVRLTSSFCTCILVGLIPRIAHTRPGWALNRYARSFFTIAGAAMFIHYTVSAIVFFSMRRIGDAKYFDGHRILPAFLIDLLLLAAILYSVAAVILSRGLAGLSEREKRSITALVRANIILAPLMTVVDQLRWLIPPLWDLYPQDDFFIMPIHLLVMSLIGPIYVAAYAARPKLEMQRPQPMLAAGLSRRESEVALLLSRGLAYKQICGELHMSMGTLNTHVQRIYRKLEVTCKEELMNLLARSSA